MVNYVYDERRGDMSDTQGLYRLIYRFYRAQIESGQYQKGEPLPAALEIAETSMFHLVRQEKLCSP